MITKIFKYETDDAVFPAHLPEEYGNYQVVINLGYHRMEDGIDNYIDILKKRFNDDKDNKFLIVVKQTFNKEKWTEFYAERQRVDLCPCCAQSLPPGYYDKSLKDAEERTKKYWGFKIIDEKYILGVAENSKNFPLSDTPYKFTPPINHPIEIIVL